jgi:(p)ppGpp synthase/HD superfamily hydrolase
MVMYASTNTQLYLQMIELGYSKEDVVRVHKAYMHAITLFTCTVHRSGDTFINHLVRTAGVLAALRVPVEVVIAGLLHSAYTHGNFGTFRRGVSIKKRIEIRDSVGSEAEQYIARYASLKWSPSSIPDLCRHLRSMDFLNRTVVLIRLANELEDHLDLGVLYCCSADTILQGSRHVGPTMIQMAETLGYPLLARDLDQAFREIESQQIPLMLRSTNKRFFLINPRRWPFYLLFRMGGHWLRRLREIVRFRTRMRFLWRALMRSIQTAR